MHTQIYFPTFRPVVVMAAPVVFAEPVLVELICCNVPYDDLVWERIKFWWKAAIAGEKKTWYNIFV